MKIGDKVRFLNEIGGGKVVAIKKNGIVLVEDEDGFKIPMQITDVAIVKSDDYSTAKTLKKSNSDINICEEEQNNRSIKAILSSHSDAEDLFLEENEEEPADKIITFKAPIVEQKGHNNISAYLAFIATNPDFSSNSSFHSYFINDSNYYIQYVYLVEKGNNWLFHSAKLVEPNTKEFIEEIDKDKLNSLGKVCIQILAYKQEKEFVLKPSINVQFRIEAVKFYKQNTFIENDFFEQPALLYTIVKEDKIIRPLEIIPEEITEGILSSKPTIHHTSKEIKTFSSDIKVNSKHKEVERVKQDKEGNNIVIADLHANNILEVMAGMTRLDILNYQLKVFRETLQKYKKKKGQVIVFIHGKGEGVLRNAILNELRYKYKHYLYQDASFQEYGYGATQVTIK